MILCIVKNKKQRVVQACSCDKFVGHVPLYLSESANKFLKFWNHHIRVVVTGKEVNRSIGLGLEIPLDYYFHGDNWAIE